MIVQPYNESIKEYINPDNQEAEVRIRFDEGKVYVRDSAYTEVTLTEAQGRWLGTELDTQFGGGGNTSLDHERLVLFTGSVNEDNVKSIQKELLRVATKEKNKEDKKPGYITLFINTFGGSYFHGVALMGTVEFIRGMGVPVYGVIQGTAFSMGSILLQACTVRLVQKYARVMIHEISSSTHGKLSDMKEGIKETELIQKAACEIYANHNTKGNNSIAWWHRKISGKDKYLSPEDCVDLGLADAVYDPVNDFKMPSIVKRAAG